MGREAAGPEAPPLFVCLKAFSPLRALNPVEEKVLALVEPIAEELALRVVRVRLSGNRRKRLQIMAERLADGGMGVEECEALSRAASPVLEAADPVAGEYDLEVSSPGIDRPLTSLDDFKRFIGFEAKLEAAGMVDGRRRFRGVIKAVEGGSITLAMPEGEATLAFAGLAEARLVMTDALIAKEFKRAEAEEAAREETKKAPKKRTKP